MKYKHKLKSVAVHISTRCESSCSFCYAEESISSNAPYTTTQEMETMFEKLSNDGVENILLLGGDPVLHPNFVDALNLAKKNDFSISVLSNSWTLKPEKKFIESVKLIDNFEATFLGSCSETHDSLTETEGSFDKLINNILRISEKNKKIGLCYSTVPQNVSELATTVEYLLSKNISIQSLMLQRVIPSGGCVGSNKFGLELEHIEILMKQVDFIYKKYNLPITFEDPVPWCTVDQKYHKYLSRCEWGYTSASIDANGNLNRCGADDHYRLGSIWDGNIQEKWNSHPILESFRSKKYLPQACQECELLEKCGGGCPLSMGTLKDHGIDYLYRKKNISCERHIIRYVFDHEASKVSRLDRKIFNEGNDDILFTKERISSLIKKSPKSVVGLFESENLIGFYVLAPITNEGIKYIKFNCLTSMVGIDRDYICKSASKADYLFLEVVALDSQNIKQPNIGLLKNLILRIKNSGKSLLVSPITEQGEYYISKLNGRQICRNATLNSDLYLIENGNGKE